MYIPKCRQTGECFARDNGKCTILSKTSETCSFQKPDREVTNGVRYPFNPDYGKTDEQQGER